MKYKIAIFDLDGTLLDTLQDLTDSTNFALESFGYPKRTQAEVRSFVGNGIEKLIERAVPDGTVPEERIRVLNVFKAHYAEHCEDKTAPYDGITELLGSAVTRNQLTLHYSQPILLCQHTATVTALRSWDSVSIMCWLWDWMRLLRVPMSLCSPHR